MLEAIRRIAEQKISEAVREGRLSVAGWRNRPLPSDNNSLVPEDLRLAYKILKNAGCVPPELELKREILKMEDLMAGLPDEKEKYRLMQRINYKIMQLNIMQHKSPLLEEAEFYYRKLMDRISDK